MLKQTLRWVGICSAAIGIPLFLAGHAHAYGCSAGVPGQTQIVATQTSGNAANAAAVATLPAPAATQRWNITGIEIQASGVTTALVVDATLAGLDGGNGAAVTADYPFEFIANVLLQSPSLNLSFQNCPLVGLPGTAVVLTLPAGGSGAAHASVNIHGFVQ